MSLTTQPKFRAVADLLEAAIATHRWPANHKLPSVRAVAEQYNVALATAARALEVLHGKGLIRPHERSGVYLVADPTASNGVTDHWAVCLRVTPGPWQQASQAVTVEGFQSLDQAPGVRLDFDAIPTDLAMSAEVLRHKVHMAQDEGITGLYFLPSRISDALAAEDELLLSICRAAGLPVVLIERNVRGEHQPLEWDLVCPDDLDGGFQCAMHLFENGRRNLAFVRAAPTSSHNDQMAGFLTAHFQARQRGFVGAGHPFPLILEYAEDCPSKEAYRRLCDKILDNAIDGVVCYQDRAVIGLAIELLARGRRVPDDVAFTGFDDQPIGQEFTLGVTTYAYPAREIAVRAFQVMRQRIKEPSAPPVKLLVPSRLIMRESSGPQKG
jgi:LacI family transcriptional regulator